MSGSFGLASWSMFSGSCGTCVSYYGMDSSTYLQNYFKETWILWIFKATGACLFNLSTNDWPHFFSWIAFFRWYLIWLFKYMVFKLFIYLFFTSLPKKVTCWAMSSGPLSSRVDLRKKMLIHGQEKVELLGGQWWALPWAGCYSPKAGVSTLCIHVDPWSWGLVEYGCGVWGRGREG